MSDFFIWLHGWQSANFAGVGGEYFFLVQSLLASVALCVWGIPLTTEMMVNASAGLAGKYFGNKSRTLVINASTNNPELATMLVAIGIGRAGGIANPLGSNFANLYLMYLVAPAIALAKWALAGRTDKICAFGKLVAREWKLAGSHVAMAALMFGFSSFTFWMMTGYSQFSKAPEDAALRPWHILLAAAGVSAAGVAVFFLWEKSLKRARPELFDSIDDRAHAASWPMFFAGTGGLIFACSALNAIFISLSEIYGAFLQGVFGTAVFAALHYFVGALVTSFPELKVAVDNYEKLTSPDLNTALSSASVSNMANLAIGVLGILLVVALSLAGAGIRL